MTIHAYLQALRDEVLASIGKWADPTGLSVAGRYSSSRVYRIGRLSAILTTAARVLPNADQPDQRAAFVSVCRECLGGAESRLGLLENSMCNEVMPHPDSVLLVWADFQVRRLIIANFDDDGNPRLPEPYFGRGWL